MKRDSVTVIEKRNSVTLQNRQVRISVNLKDGTWSGADRTTGVQAFQKAHFRVDDASIRRAAEPKTRIRWSKKTITSALGTGTTLRVSYQPQEGYWPERLLELSLFENRPFIQIAWGIRNQHDHNVRVQNVDVMYAGHLFADQTVEHPWVLRGGAGAEPNIVEQGWEIDAINSAMLTYKDGNQRRTFVAGGLGYAEFARRVMFSDMALERNAAKTACMNLTCWDPQGKRVAPGETYLSKDTFYLDFVTQNPFEALETYGDALRTANKAKPNNYNFPTLCGWMVSVGFGERLPINNSPGLVNQMDLAVERGLLKYTPLAVRLEPDYYCYGDHGNTQQGWWNDEHWAKYGSLLEPYETFAKFCGAVAERGGIPFTYFQCSMPSNDFATAHPTWMLNKDISQVHAPHRHHHPFVRYDYTHPDFRAHVLKVWKRLRKAGLKGVKFDYPETAWAQHGGFHDTSFTTVAAYRELFRLCREGLGPDAFLHERILGGTTHEEAPRTDVNAGIVDLQRVWGDASHFEPEMASRIGLRWYKSRRVFLYYPDGKSFFRGREQTPIPTHERRAFLTLIAFLSGRLELGTSIGSLTDPMLHDMTRIYPAFGGTQSPRPVDMLLGKPHPEVYDYAVTPDWHQVVLLNNAKRKKTVSAPLSGDQAQTGSLGLDRQSAYHVFDFWEQSYVGKLKGRETLALSVRGQAVSMLSIRKVATHPQMISSNRHIMQGMMECHAVQWDGRRRELSGKVDVVGGEPFVLTIACNGWKMNEIKAAGCEIEKRKDGRGLIDLLFSATRNQRKSFTLRFEPKKRG